MKTYKYFLNEMSPIAKIGNYDTFINNTSYSKNTISRRFEQLKFNKIFTNKEILLFKEKNNNYFILGFWAQEDNDRKDNTIETRFNVIGFLTCKPRNKSLENIIKIKNILIIDTVYIDSHYRDSKLGKLLYTTLIGMNYVILSDDTQYDGARKLWNNLSFAKSLTVNIIDMNDKKVIENDVILNHGDNIEDFNTKYWSSDESKSHIRFLLIKRVN